VRYEVTSEPAAKLQCHCRECQYISGGGPNFAMLVPNEGFAFTEGSVTDFKRGDIDGARTRQFCTACGTHLTIVLPGRGLTAVKVGTLDDPTGDYGDSQFAIFMKDAQPFHTVADGKTCFDATPPPK